MLYCHKKRIKKPGLTPSLFWVFRYRLELLIKTETIISPYRRSGDLGEKRAIDQYLPG